MALEKFNWQNGSQVEPAKVEVEGVSYEVVDAQYEGETPLSAANLNLMQDTLLSNVKDNLEDESKIASCKAVKDIFSTDEVKTNKVWLGKPVYRKVYIFSVTNGLNAEVYSINNVSDIWINFDISFIKTPTRINPACRADYRNETYSIGSFLDIGDKQIYVLLGSDASLPGTAYITVEYTKTTD